MLTSQGPWLQYAETLYPPERLAAYVPAWKVLLDAAAASSNPPGLETARCSAPAIVEEAPAASADMSDVDESIEDSIARELRTLKAPQGRQRKEVTLDGVVQPRKLRDRFLKVPTKTECREFGLLFTSRPDDEDRH